MKHEKIISILILICLLNLLACAQQEQNDTIIMEDFIEKYNSDSSLVVLDVRTEAELSGSLGKLDRIINIPIQQLDARLNELSKYKDNEIVVICRTGNRSGTATQFLREKGFNAKNVLGGMAEYRELEKNKN
jgi:rhodanese-related sulfurtransferase